MDCALMCDVDWINETKCFNKNNFPQLRSRYKIMQEPLEDDFAHIRSFPDIIYL